MADPIHFSEFPIPVSWVWGGTTGYLGLFSGEQWTDQNGGIHLRGIAEEADAPFQRCPLTVDGSQALVLAFDYQPTTLSIDRNNSRITGVLFDENGVPVYVLFRGWFFPETPSPMTWTSFTLANHTKQRRLQDRYGTWAMVVSLFQQVLDGLGGILAATTVVLGAVRMSRAPAVAGAPIAVSDNDERLMKASGIAVIINGVVVVAYANVTADSRIKASSMSRGVIGSVLVDVDELDPGGGFIIRTSNEGDNGPVYWQLFEP